MSKIFDIAKARSNYVEFKNQLSARTARCINSQIERASEHGFNQTTIIFATTKRENELIIREYTEAGYDVTVDDIGDITISW